MDFFYNIKYGFLNKVNPKIKLLVALVVSCLLFIVKNNMFSFWLLLFFIISLYFLQIFYEIFIQTIIKYFIYIIFLFFLTYMNESFVFSLGKTCKLLDIILINTLLFKTTDFIQIINSFEYFFNKIPYFNRYSQKLALMIFLTINFIFLLKKIINEIKEIQKSRGINVKFYTLFLPFIFRAIKSSTEISEAIQCKMNIK